MKLRNSGILFLILSSLTVVMVGCPGPNTPSSPGPSGPANTTTFTPTGSYTPTETPTRTPSATSTETPTKTPSRTATDSPTVTVTRTPSNTPTETLTRTPSATPTDSPTPTETSTLTNTVPASATRTPTQSPTASPTRTPTNTATASPTGTPTLCPTQAATATPVANGFSIQGSITYSPGLTGGNSIRVVAFDTGGNNKPQFQIFTSSPASYNLQGLINGHNYYVFYWYGSGTSFNNGPLPGQFISAFGTTGCSVASATLIPVTGNMTGFNQSFNTTNVGVAVSGTASYTGSLGPVDGCQGIHMELWPISTTLNGASGSVTCSGCNSIVNNQTGTNGALFNMVDAQNDKLCAATSYKLLVYYQVAGTSGNGIQPGDPYSFQTVTSSSTLNNANTTFSDTSIY